MDITKVIVPAAGITDLIPRALVPLLEKPAIYHIAQEAYLSRIEQMITITSDATARVYDSFCLQEADYKKIIDSVQLSTIRQYERLGTGHAVWHARHTIAKEYFAVAYPDDLIFGKQPALAQMMRVARQEKVSVIAVQEVPPTCVSSYGVVGIKKTITPNLFQISSIVEKPDPKDAPSSLAVVGRYVLSYKIMDILSEIVAYNQQDVSLTDAMSKLLHSNERVFAYKVQGMRCDIGTPLGYIKAAIATGLQDKQLAPSIRSFVADLDSPESFIYQPTKMLQDTL